MNLPNKITISRLIIAVIMIFFAVFPWANVGASSIFQLNTKTSVF